MELGAIDAYTSNATSTELADNLKAIRLQLHLTIEKVADDYGRRHSFNTAISSVMELMNALAKIEGTDEVSRQVRQEVLQNVALLLSPIVPHICQAIWAELCPKSHILDTTWPTADPLAMVQDSVEYVIQVNGKLRGSITVAKTENKESLEKLALQQPFVQKFIEAHMTVRKIVVVPNKLINVVVA